MTRKILAMLLAMAMLLSMVIVPASANEQPESLTEQAQEVAAEEGAALPEEQPEALPKEEPLEESVQMPLLDANYLQDKTVTLTMTPQEPEVTLENGVAYVTYDLYLQTSDATPIQACAFNLMPRKLSGDSLQETSGMQLASQFPGNSPEFYYSCEADALSRVDLPANGDSYGHPYNLIAYTPSSGYFALSGYDLNGGGIANSQTQVMTIVAKFTESGTYQLTAANCIAGNGKLEDGDIQQFGTFAVDTQPVTVKKAAGAVNVTAAANKTSVDVGDTFTVTLSHGAMTVSSFTAGLSFDTDVLEVTQIETKDGYTALTAYAARVQPQMSTVDEANKTGKVGFGIVAGSDHAYAAADIVTVTFKAVAAGSTAVTPYETSTSQSASVDGDGTAVNVTAAYAIDEGTLIIGVKSDKEKVHPGDTVAVDISFEQNPGLAVFGMNIVYDKEQLTLTSITGKSETAYNSNLTADVANSALFWYSTNDVTTTGTAFTLGFTVKGTLNFGTEIPVSLSLQDDDPENVSSNDVAELPFALAPAKIVVAHNLVKTSAKTPSCVEGGNNEYYTCSGCGKVFKDSAATIETTVEKELLPAAGHSMTAADYTKYLAAT